MTVLVIPPRERGMVRVFSVAVPRAEVAAMAEADAAEADPERRTAARWLTGYDALRPRYATLVRIADLGPLPLSDFLMQSEDIPETALAADAARLDALTDFVLIVLSEAVPDTGAEIDLGGRLTLIGTYATDAAPVRFAPLPAGGASGVVAGSGRARSNRRAMGLVSLVTLLVMFALIAFVIWIAA